LSEEKAKGGGSRFAEFKRDGRVQGISWFGGRHSASRGRLHVKGKRTRKKNLLFHGIGNAQKPRQNKHPHPTNMNTENLNVWDEREGYEPSKEGICERTRSSLKSSRKRAEGWISWQAVILIRRLSQKQGGIEGLYVGRARKVK